MKKIIIAILVVLVVLPLVALLGLRLGWSSLIEPRVRGAIVEAASKQDYKLSVDPLQLKSWWFPIEVQATNIHLQHRTQEQEVKVPFLGVVFSPTTWTTDPEKLDGHVVVTLQKPQVTVTQRLQPEGEKASVEVEADKEAGASGGGLPPLSISLKISEGLFALNQQTEKGFNQVALSGAQGSVTLPPLLGGDNGSIDLSGALAYKIVSSPFPIQGGAPLSLSSQSLQINEQKVGFNPLQINLGGLSLGLNGFSQTDEQNWQVSVEVKNLSELQKGGLLPEGQWQGGLRSDIQFRKKGEAAPSFSGTLAFNQLQGRLAKPVEKEGTRVSGGLTIQGDLEFAYDAGLQKLNSNLSADLSALSLLKKDVFHKKSGTPMSLQIQSSVSGEKINVSKLQVQLAQISAAVKGELSPQKGQSRLAMTMDKTSLAGLENIFLIMKKYPVKGHLALQADVVGDLSNPESLNVSANPIDLQIASGVNYQNADKTFQLQGPFSGNLKGQMQIVNKDIEQADLQGRVDLDQMDIQTKQGFRKKANQKLNLVFNGGKKGKLFQFQKFFIKTFFGSLDAQGSLSNPLNPQLNIAGKINSIQLGALKTVMPSFKNFPLSGEVNGEIQLSGRYDPELGIEKSPLTVSGEMLHNSSLLKWTSPKKPKDSTLSAKESEPSKKTKVAAEPLLPDWPIVKTAKMAVESKIEKLIFNDLTVTNFFLKGRYDQGVLTGRLSMQRLFSGSLDLKDVRSDLYAVPTYIEGTAVTKELDLKEAVTWGVPEQKDLIKGQMTGGFKVKMPFPSHADPLKKTQSSGTLKIQGFEVSTMKLDQLINGLLQKVPGLKNKKKVQTKDVRALFQTQYRFADGELTYKDTNFLTPENHQLLAHGTFNTDKTINLDGRLFVSGVKIDDRLQSCLLDKEGRLEMPVEYRGSIVSPKLSNATQAIEKVAGRYLECEKKSQLKKVKGEVKKEADKILKKEGKKLEEKLKEKIKDFF